MAVRYEVISMTSDTGSELLKVATVSVSGKNPSMFRGYTIYVDGLPAVDLTKCPNNAATIELPKGTHKLHAFGPYINYAEGWSNTLVLDLRGGESVNLKVRHELYKPLLGFLLLLAFSALAIASSLVPVNAVMLVYVIGLASFLVYCALPGTVIKLHKVAE